MGYDHEFGKSRYAEDGMVRGLDVCHLELDVLCTVVFFVPKVTGSVTEPIGVAAFSGTMP
jgi:hypothetical protein